MATQLQITKTTLKLAQLDTNVSSLASDAMAATPPSSLMKLRSAIAPNASSSPSLPSEFAEIPSLDQLHSRKKAGASLPNNFLFSPKGTVDYDKIIRVSRVCVWLLRILQGATRVLQSSIAKAFAFVNGARHNLLLVQRTKFPPLRQQCHRARPFVLAELRKYSRASSDLLYTSGSSLQPPNVFAQRLYSCPRQSQRSPLQRMELHR